MAGLVLLVVVALAGLCNAASGKAYSRTVSYAGQKVYSCRLNSSSEAARLASDADLDVWKVSADRRADIRTLSARGDETLRRQAACEVVIESVEQWMAEHEAEEKAKRRRGQALRNGKTSVNSSLDWFDEYHPFEDIIGFYTSLAASHPTLVTLTPSIGQSIELRPMPAVKITAANGAPTTPKILLTCQIHAREWVSSSTCMYLAQSFVEGFETDEVIRDILTNAELHIIPFLNPDGYAYSWTTDRLWRKNRRINENSGCRGVDLNRNFNIRWAEPGGGSSGNPCSETYHGTAPESEPEIEHFTKYFEDHPPMVAGIDYHSYSQLILRPWGFTHEPPPFEEQLKAIGDAMQEKIYEVHGQTYVSEPGMDLYPTVGTSSDWFFSDDASSSNGGFRCAGYTIELRDTGHYGFILPPSQIIPTGEENFAGLVYFIVEYLKNPLPFH